jgi:hypothetical protein
MWKQNQSEIIAAQDQALQTKYETKTVQTETDSKCRLCQQYDETWEHNTSAHPTATNEKHIRTYRDKIVCAQLHFIKCMRISIKLENKHWYDHIQRLADTSHGGKATILWNQQVQTDSTNLTINRTSQSVIMENEYACW